MVPVNYLQVSMLNFEMSIVIFYLSTIQIQASLINSLSIKSLIKNIGQQIT